MKERLLELLVCPCSAAKEAVRLECEVGERDGEEIISGILKCPVCSRTYTIKNGIPRFVSDENYASNFGFQWNRFRKTQLDSFSGKEISWERLSISTGWDPAEMAGKRILDVGCGSGRFAEIALRAGGKVLALDYSSAVDAARENLQKRFLEFEAVQASVFQLPFREGSFDFIYCLGVLQHTPDPEKAFGCLPEKLKPGGKLAVDIYPFLWQNVFWSKYWLRPLTKRISRNSLMQAIEFAAPALLKISKFISAIPLIGGKLKYVVPVANYAGVYDLSEEQLREWAILDTFDMLSPEHDHPKSAGALERWFRESALVDVEIFRRGHLIGRGRRRPTERIERLAKSESVGS